MNKMSGNDERILDYSRCICDAPVSRTFWICLDKRGGRVLYLNSDLYIGKENQRLKRVNIDVQFAQDDNRINTFQKACDMIREIRCSSCKRTFSKESRMGNSLMIYMKLNWENRSLGI